MIPVFRPSYGQEEFDAVREVMSSGWVGLGPKTREFEEKFQAYLGSGYASALNSGTAALHLAMLMADIKGREVITTPMTFVSTNHAILYSGGIPVFADIEPDTCNIDADCVEKLITKKTRAIVVVHYGGHACRMDKIMRLARKHKLLVIEDCAHAAGGEFKGKKLGTFGDFACFSFHAVKNLATGEGGMLVCRRKADYQHATRLRWLGISKDTWSRETKVKYSWYYFVEEVGWKAHLNDIPSAIGIVQLRRLDQTNAARRERAERYGRELADLDWMTLPVVQPNTAPAWHNYVIKTEHRDGLNAWLAQRGIATGVHYIPNNHYPMYKRCKGKTPVCEKVWATLLTLPLFPDLTADEQSQVIAEIRAYGRDKGLNA
ncbi:MAG TPA: DegT/DnrJ/EryC1/StrS family aminotransferase [Phycisphaerae bacterium]|nr:DegT/DnrJ/EryC1/StrS family aminotransferase [Phycisphaerae bacterium]HOI53794.1 DegT/DnrJ/EryC1/StrS family aminotransferase [Phycisphaerae bacterium]